MRALILMVLVTMQSSIGFAQGTPWQLVCFKDDGLNLILDKVVNKMQLLNNDLGQIVSRKDLNKAGCDYARIPSGSTFVYKGFLKTKEGFIFPKFRATFADTGNEMFGVDGIFDAKHWDVIKHVEGYVVPGDRSTVYSVRRYRDGNIHRFEGVHTWKLMPKTCDVLSDFIFQSGGYVPDYMAMPVGCREYRNGRDVRDSGRHGEVRKRPMTPEQQRAAEMLRR